MVVIILKVAAMGIFLNDISIPNPETKWQPWSTDSSDKRQHDAATGVPGAHDGPVGCKIKLFFIEAFVC